MKRKEIYVAVIIDTISPKYNCDEAYIFNTEKEAVEWAEDIKKSMEDMGCPLCENQLFIQKVDQTIDYLNPPIGTICPVGKNGEMAKIPSIIEAQIDVLNKLKKYLHIEDFDTLDERWIPESEFCAIIDELIKEVQNEN